MRACIAALALIVATPLAAATRTWSGAVDGNWSNPANWDGTAPVAGDDLVFPAGATTMSTTNDFPDGMMFHSIQTDVGGYAFAGHRIVLGSGGTLIAGIVGSTIAFDITLGADQYWFGGIYTGAINLDGHSLKATGIFEGPISGIGSLTGAIYLGLFGPNAYAGPTTVANADLDLAGPSPFGLDDGTAQNSTTLGPNVRVGLISKVSTSGNEQITIGSNVRFQRDATLGGPVTLTQFPLIANGSVTLNGNVAGDTVLFDGCGTITLASAHNSFNAIAQASSPSCATTRLRLGLDNALPPGIPVTLGNGAVLDLNGFSATISSLSASTGSVDLHGGTLTLNGPSSASVLHANALNGPGTVIVKGGEFLFGGLHPGSFVVNGGHLILSDRHEGSVTVTGGTLTLSGSATRIAATGGTVSAGEGVTNPRCDSLELGPGATYLGGRTLVVSGSVDLGGAKLERPWWGTLIDNAGTGSVRGTFAGLPERSIVSCGNGPGLITYAGGTGNDVVLLQAVDIPALGPLALMITALALAGVALLRIGR